LNKHLKVGLISKYIYFYYVLSIEPNRWIGIIKISLLHHGSLHSHFELSFII
jgi:hypothetical protein